MIGITLKIIITFIASYNSLDSCKRILFFATFMNNDNNDAKFIRLQGLSQAAKDRKMNEKKVKKPQNIHVSILVC